MTPLELRLLEIRHFLGPNSYPLPKKPNYGGVPVDSCNGCGLPWDKHVGHGRPDQLSAFQVVLEVLSDDVLTRMSPPINRALCEALIDELERRVQRENRHRPNIYERIVADEP